MPNAKVANLIHMVSGSLWGKVFGYARDVVIAAAFGATRAMDAFLLGTAITQVLTLVLQIGMSNAIVPAYMKSLNRGDAESGRKTAWSMIVAAGALGVAITAVGLLGLHAAIRLIGIGFTRAEQVQAYALTAWLMPTVLLGIEITVLTALCQAHRRFGPVAYVGIPSSVVVMAAVLAMRHRLGILAIVYGTVAAYVVQLLWLGIALRDRIRPHVDVFHDQAIRGMVRLSTPTTLSTVAAQIAVLVDRGLASGLTPGSMTALTFANRVYGLPLYVGVAPVTGVLFPDLSEAWQTNAPSVFRRQVQQTAAATIVLTSVLGIEVILNHALIAGLLFRHGAYSASAAEITGQALEYLAIALPADALSQTMTKVSFIVGDAVGPMWWQVVGALARVAVDLILIRPLGVVGLALGNAIGVMMNYCGLTIRIWRRLRMSMVDLVAPCMVACVAGLGAAGTHTLAIHVGLPRLAVGVGDGVLYCLFSVLYLKAKYGAASALATNGGGGG